jgi:hypothetical protein
MTQYQILTILKIQDKNTHAKEELPSISVYHYENNKHKCQKEISVNWICITAFERYDKF